jgi:hypothetical protein
MLTLTFGFWVVCPNLTTDVVYSISLEALGKSTAYPSSAKFEFNGTL